MYTVVYTNVYTSIMAKLKNITFSADEDLIEAARKGAAEQGTTLNEQFREWLANYTKRQKAIESLRRAQEASKGVEWPILSREERNAR